MGLIKDAVKDASQGIQQDAPAAAASVLKAALEVLTQYEIAGSLGFKFALRKKVGS